MKTKRQYNILRTIDSGKYHFTEIYEYLGWSKATISRYLSSLIKLNFLRKDVTEEGRVGYFLTEKGKEYLDNYLSLAVLNEKFKEKRKSKDFWINALEDEKKTIEELKKLGIFKKKLDYSDLIPYIKKQREYNDLPEMELYSDILGLVNFFATMPLELQTKFKLKGKIKLEGNPDKLIEEINNRIKKIKKEGIPFEF